MSTNSNRPLYFQTSGIRGKTNLVINPDLAVRVAKAIAIWLKSKFKDLILIYIGYDNRRNSRYIANCLAATLSACGINVKILSRYVPTPLIIYTTIQKQANAGIMVTGSHLPPDDNGIILFDNNGNYYKGILSEENSESAYVKWENSGLISQVDSEIQDYKQFLKQIRDKISIKVKNDLKILIDPAHGPMGEYLEFILKDLVGNIVKINWEFDDTFPGRLSEPAPENLKDTSKAVVTNNCDLGIATDMDGDRIIFIKKNGEIIIGDEMGAIFSKYIWENNPNLPIVIPINTSASINILAKKLNKKFEYCKVGPPAMISAIKKFHAKYAFEETGKYLFTDYGGWPDANISTLVLLKILQDKNSDISTLHEDIPKLKIIKTKISFPRDQAENLMSVIKKAIPIEFSEIKNINELDGLRITFENNSWILIRPSGTEDYVRIFSEHESVEESQKLIHQAEKFVSKIINNK